MRRVAQGTKVHILEGESFEFESVRVLGTTLWTDFRALGERRKAECMGAAAESINDFALIRRVRPDGTFVRLQPEDVATWRANSVRWLTAELEKPFH